MQQSQRSGCNHALEYAIERANSLGLPVLVAFGLTPCFPEATRTHYDFMLAGLRETAADLMQRGVGFVLGRGDPVALALGLADCAALTVVDGGCLRLQRQWRERFAANACCPVVEVESDVVVPIGSASAKEEFAAATLRPKLGRQWDQYLVPLREREVGQPWSAALLARAGTLDDGHALPGLALPARAPRTVAPGRRAALTRLESFVRGSLARYHLERSNPAEDLGSGLSAHLHFGQISALETALAVRAADVCEAAKAAFLEELLVRRELARNFVHYNPRYDAYSGLPSWSRISLEAHAADPRPYRYRPEDLADAHTHDPYWNAAQVELLTTGRMHGYMRMYWGKKILEWTADPETAFGIALELNNRYELDGRDANGFTGVAWCLGKHDRPWQERPVFGKVRSMTANGLCRKFDMEAYVARVAAPAGGTGTVG
jgi:deoxyribodipyrimidine photo-lyase